MLHGLNYNHGIFTVWVYSSHSLPKIFDRICSSSGENSLEPIYTIIPIGIPNQLLQSMPAHGSTSSATPAYNGCFTKEYGPVVISSLRGILVTIKKTDHAQLIIPGNKIIIEIIDKVADGPPTVK